MMRAPPMPIPATDPIVNIPIVTPFDDADRADHEALARNMQRRPATPAAGFLVGSQTGEEWYLSEEEKAGCRADGQGMPGRAAVPDGGGVDCPSATETLRRAEAFADVGAEVVRIRFPRNESVIVPYLEQVLARCPVPVLLMHQCDPARCGAAAEPAAPPEVLGAVADMDNVFGYVTDHDVRFEACVHMRCRQQNVFRVLGKRPASHSGSWLHPRLRRILNVAMTEVTQILQQIESGDPSAAEELLPLVYDELQHYSTGTT